MRAAAARADRRIAGSPDRGIAGSPERRAFQRERTDIGWIAGRST
jgi:hypothetical protein